MADKIKELLAVLLAFLLMVLLESIPYAIIIALFLFAISRLS